MNNKILNAILFTTGAVIGSLVTWKIVKTKYSCIAQEEIDSVKEEYASLMQKMKDKLNESVTYKESKDLDSNNEDDDNDFSDDNGHEMTEYYNIVKKYRGANDDDNGEEGGNRDNEDESEVPYINGPYVISPDDFASSPPGYSAEPLDYFADGVLADGWGVELDIEETIGEDALNHFGEYADDDIVYVRNERKEIDYEVTRDPRTYAEATQVNPNPYYGQ